MARTSYKPWILGGAVAAAGLAFWLWPAKKAPEAPQSAGPAVAASAPVPITVKQTRATPTRPPSAPSGYHVDYFNRTLLGTPIVAKLYNDVKPLFPPGVAGELTAIYIAEGPVRNGSGPFVQFMNALHEDVHRHSRAIADLLIENDAALRRDAFVYQMALNLAFNLDLPPAEKAKALGPALTIPFTRDPKTGVTMMTANITNALILMKNSGVTLEQARPYIERGLAVNSTGPDARQEYIARVNAYYPGAL